MSQGDNPFSPPVQAKNKTWVVVLIVAVASVSPFVLCGGIVFLTRLEHSQKPVTDPREIAHVEEASEEEQQKRNAAIEIYREAGVIVGEQTVSGTPHVAIDPRKFAVMQFGDKERLAAMICAWHYKMATIPRKGERFSVKEMVVFHDTFTNKRIATFTPIGGLDLH